MQLKGLVFDLDDTLYLEQDYVLSGFSTVASFLTREFHLNKDELNQFLEVTFLTQGRNKIFNLLLEEFLPEENASYLIPRLVEVYRNHKPSISLSPDFLKSLNYLKSQGLKLGLLTDGLPLMQQNKVASLGLDKIFNCIIYNWEIKKPKPNTEAIELLLDNLNLKAQKVIYIGDNPEHDITPAKKLGLLTFRVLQGRFKAQTDELGYFADFYAANLQEVFIEIQKYVSN